MTGAQRFEQDYRTRVAVQLASAFNAAMRFDLLKWEDLPEDLRAGWLAAADVAIGLVKVAQPPPKLFRIGEYGQAIPLEPGSITYFEVEQREHRPVGSPVQPPRVLGDSVFRPTAGDWCGHGHVTPRPDGVRARCGGPGLCSVCSREKLATAGVHKDAAMDEAIEVLLRQEKPEWIAYQRANDIRSELGDVHVMPDIAEGHPHAHKDSSECWCKPKLEADYTAQGGRRLWVHQEVN